MSDKDVILSANLSKARMSESRDCRAVVAGRSGGVGVEDIKHVYRLRDKFDTEGRLKMGVQI